MKIGLAKKWRRLTALALGACLALGAVLTLSPPAKADGYQCDVGSDTIAQCFPDPNLAEAVATAMNKNVMDVPNQ